MAVGGVKNNFSYLFGILTVFIYAVGLILIGRGLGFVNILVITVALISYYVANVFSITARKYRLRDLATVMGINGILAFLTVISNIFKFYEGIIIFGLITLFQIVFRYTVNMVAIDKQRIIFVGLNGYSADLLTSINEDEQYRLIVILENGSKLETKSRVLEMCESRKIDIIVDFDENLLEDPKFVDSMLQYKLRGIQYFNYLDFYEIYERKLPVAHLSPKWFLEDTGFEIYHNSFNLKAKRVLDLFFALLIGFFVFPLMIIAAVIVKLESRGPVFFIQERIGQGNRPFRIVKFRSMTTDAEKDGPQWASKNDSRVTRWGKIMRATRIDELPQLWNVLKGEMSFVGPRPEREYFIQQLEKEIPYYNLRHTVKPGLTGWAQVMYPYGSSTEDAYRKLQYDLYYIKYHDLLFDVKVLLKTVNIVVFGKGR